MLNVKKINKKNLLLTCYILVLTAVAQGQVDTSFQKKTIAYSDYMEAVAKNNKAFAAEKFNIPISEAGIEMAKVIPDPEFSAGIFNNDQRNKKMGYGYTAELDWTIELGGKRKARVDLAKSESELSKHILIDYFRNLQADATLQYLLSIQHEQLVKLQLNSYEAMSQLAKSDSMRAKLGAITEVDAKQSKLEASTLWNEATSSIGSWKSSLSNLALLMGNSQMGTLLATVGDFSAFHRNFQLAELIESAQLNRTDLLYALQNKDVSEKMIKLAKANRIIDLGLVAGVEYNATAKNETAPSPSFTQSNIGVRVPLKFSNKRKGELKAAYYTAQQSEVAYSQVELQVQRDVTQAFYQYEATQKQLQQFDSGLLQDAKSILDGKLYSYKRGETSLLEVLTAQRTYNEVLQHYYEIRFNNAVALVELERSVGIWDINF